MIRDLDDTLKRLLVEKTPLDPTQVDVNFEVPDREWSTGLAKPTINLYLYDIRENRELRDADWPTERGPDGGSGRRRAPLRIDLSYLVTAWTRAVEDEHHLLWLALYTLSRHPLISGDLLEGELKYQGRPLRLLTAQGDGVLKNPADFWTALDNQLKPSVTLLVTVEMDLDLVIPAPPVGEIKINVGPRGTVPSEGNNRRSAASGPTEVIGRTPGSGEKRSTGRGREG
jgi:hypothetical protein